MNNRYCTPSNGILQSPVIDPTGVAGEQLQLRWMQAWSILPTDKAYAEVSLNGGSTWTALWEMEIANYRETWTEMTYDISHAAGGTFQIRWVLQAGQVFIPGTSIPVPTLDGYYVDHVRIIVVK